MTRVPARFSTRRRRRAFTLIEAIVAIVVLTVAVPPMLWSLRDAHARRVDPVLASRARFLCMERLDEIMADRHSLTRGYTYIAGANYPAEPSLSGFPGCARSVQISETGANLSTSGTGYKTVTVTVAYVDGRGASRSVSLSTVLTDYTP